MYYLVANWKMNLLRKEAATLVDQIQKSLFDNRPRGEIIICPPFTLLDESRKSFDKTLLKLGGQDCSSFVSGAYTGDISAMMLRDMACDYVILGHSERRAIHQETSELIKAKAEAAIEAGVMPIICIGESLEARQSKMTFQLLEQQLLESIPRTIARCLIAYEPIWAIGSGITPTLAEINEVGSYIRKIIEDKFMFTKIPKILYGGSVNDTNCAEIVSLSCIDGLLVGGASLSADKFIKIITICDKLKS